jgi:hypothetical protein
MFIIVYTWPVNRYSQLYFTLTPLPVRRGGSGKLRLLRYWWGKHNTVLEIDNYSSLNFFVLTNILQLEDDSLLGYSTVQSRRSIYIFQRCLLPLTPGRRCRQCTPLTRRCTSMKLYGAIFQKAAISIFATV